MQAEVLQRPWNFDGQGVNVTGGGDLSGVRLFKLQEQDFPIAYGNNPDRELVHQHLVDLHNKWLKEQSESQTNLTS